MYVRLVEVNYIIFKVPWFRIRTRGSCNNIDVSSISGQTAIHFQFQTADLADTIHIQLLKSAKKRVVCQIRGTAAQCRV